MEDRRGFLKTLGKLGVALGITTAACSSHHHHVPHPKHPKHPKRPFSETEALSHAVQKAGFNRTNGGDDMTWADLDAQKAHSRATPKAKMKAGFTGFASNSHTVPSRDKTAKMDWGQGTATEEAQKAIDAINNLRLDNISMSHDPRMTYLPPHAYSYLQQREAMRSLDPYNWGAIFDLEWHDWRTDDPSHATVTGWWLATVKPRYRGIFPNETYAKTQRIAMHYLVERVGTKAQSVKDYAKDNCYRKIVDKLQDEILEVIKRDVKANA